MALSFSVRTRFLVLWLCLACLCSFFFMVGCQAQLPQGTRGDQGVQQPKEAQQTQGAQEPKGAQESLQTKETQQAQQPKEDFSMALSYLKTTQDPQVIYLAGGCFWGMEAYFKQIPGVLQTQVGYANGTTDDTTYERVPVTDHAETVELTYDAYHLSLPEILAHYLRVVDPLSLNRQGNDQGRQYRTGIYYLPDTPAESIPLIKDVLDKTAEKLGQPVAIELAPLKNFVVAEDYHQDYLEKNPRGYCHVDLSLADKPLDPKWANYKKPDQETLRQQLTPDQYAITQEEGTDPPFSHPYDKLDEPGIYVDIVSGEPLFSSRDKFDGGCGWPSFSRPIRSQNVHYKVDHRLPGMDRVEVKSQAAQSHLGHVFDDGPSEKGQLRYCIDGSALRFIPLSKMKEEGYEAYIADVTP